MTPPQATDPDITLFDKHLSTAFEKFLVLSWYLAHPDLTEWPPNY